MTDIVRVKIILQLAIPVCKAFGYYVDTGRTEVIVELVQARTSHGQMVFRPYQTTTNPRSLRFSPPNKSKSTTLAIVTAERRPIVPLDGAFSPAHGAANNCSNFHQMPTPNYISN